MKNKIFSFFKNIYLNVARIVQKSISRELTLVIFFCLVVSGIIYWNIQQVSFQNANGLQDVINNSNSAFVEINWLYSGRDKEAGADYLSKLARYYNLRIAFVDEQGNVILKSDNLVENKLDLEQIRKIRRGGYDGSPLFYSVYPMKFDSQNTQVIIIGTPHSKTVAIYGRDPLFAISIGITIFIGLLLLLLRKKTKYIKEIAAGILEISKGNLDYKVPKKGQDELGLLADNINFMSEQLKVQINEERKAEKTKNELITNVSHDLKTPLTSIIGYLALLKDKKYETEEQMIECLEIAYRKAEKLSKLVRDLFEYTKLINGAVTINKSTINLVELIEQLIGELSLMAKENDVVFLKAFPVNNVIVEVDSNIFVRAVENILVNAIKYSYRHGRIKIEITQDVKRTLIMVENSCDAISIEDLCHLFDRFFRLDKSRTSDIGGSGLGLSIAKTIVELHNGEIWAEAEKNTIKLFISLLANSHIKT